MEKRVVSFKLEPDLVELLDRACHDVGFSNRSACLRALVSSFISITMKMDNLDADEAVNRAVLDMLLNNNDHDNAVVAATVAAARVISQRLKEAKDHVNRLLLLFGRHDPHDPLAMGVVA